MRHRVTGVPVVVGECRPTWALAKVPRALSVGLHRCTGIGPDFAPNDIPVVHHTNIAILGRTLGSIDRRRALHRMVFRPRR
jgi:hypothetical protein